MAFTEFLHVIEVFFCYTLVSVLPLFVLCKVPLSTV